MEYLNIVLISFLFCSHVTKAFFELPVDGLERGGLCLEGVRRDIRRAESCKESLKKIVNDLIAREIGTHELLVEAVNLQCVGVVEFLLEESFHNSLPSFVAFV